MRTSPNRLIGTVFGCVYVLVGSLGFAVTGGVAFIATEGSLLLGIFEVNPLHNLAHLLIGTALLIAGLSNASSARATTTGMGALCLVLGLGGFVIADSALDILALNTADHLLHLASGIVLLGIGLTTDKDVGTLSSGTPTGDTQTSGARTSI